MWLAFVTFIVFLLDSSVLQIVLFYKYVTIVNYLNPFGKHVK